MSLVFPGETDTSDSKQRPSGAPGRPRATSGSTLIEVVNSSKRPPSPPPRRSSRAFSSHQHSNKYRTSTSKSPKPLLRRKLKLLSLRSRADPTLNQDNQDTKQIIMSSPAVTTAAPTGERTSHSLAERDAKHSLPMPGLSGSANGPVGNLLKGPVDETGKLKDAALLVGIKLDLEAEVHATARVRGDIVVGIQGVALCHPSVCRRAAVAVVSVVLRVWATGPKGFLMATFRSLVLTLV
ncbi:hypothetical protein AAE478_006539 [Parahypoxylon ruwenzoriense]